MQPVDPLATIVHKESAYKVGKALAARLKELIPRQQFKVPIQAAIGARIVASESISGMSSCSCLIAPRRPPPLCFILFALGLCAFRIYTQWSVLLLLRLKVVVWCAAMRKDVLAKCYGGDISRKKKLLKKQAAGKKRMKVSCLCCARDLMQCTFA